MKIKQVCEQTGLTDRAIRYYIEEGLVSPSHTENYMGRRAYDFSEEDVTALNHVATLRKFGFTVEEIRRIFGDPQESVVVLADVRARKEETVRQESDNLDALARLEADRAYTVAELAQVLEEPVKAADVPKEDRWLTWKERLISWVAATPEWVVMLLPMVVLLLVVIWAEIDMRYLQYDQFLLLLPRWIVPTLLPTIAIGVVKLVNRFRFKPVRTATRVLVVVLCVLYMPVSMLFNFVLGFSLYESSTDNPAHYLQTDRTFWMPQLAWELFPDAPHTMTYTWQEGAYRQQTTDVTYHYYNNYDGCYDLYAAWQLSPEELAAEIARVEALMGGEEGLLRGNHGAYVYLAVAEDLNTPFDAPEGHRWYVVTMFAWNAKTGEVRYVSCERRDVLPWYMMLDWDE